MEVNAASNDVQHRSGQMKSMQEGTDVQVSSWGQAIPRRYRQEDRED